MVYNTVTKIKDIYEMGTEDFLLDHHLPPYLFVVFKDRWIYGYRLGMLGVDEPVEIRISKLEPRAIARFNSGYFVGGYNRSPLPGNRRSTTRSIYYIG
jgi:hypothetical protein